MNQHDINRIANALWVLLQYKGNEKFKEILTDSSDHITVFPYEFISALEDLQTYF